VLVDARGRTGCGLITGSYHEGESVPYAFVTPPLHDKPTKAEYLFLS